LTAIKQKLFRLCSSFVEERITAAKQAIQLAQSSANEETKSSAGDKYETGRAMAQLEIENSSAHLAEAMKLKQVLDQINPDQETNTAQLGSLVLTSQGNYYIAISAGKLLIDGTDYYAISAVSPVGTKLMKLRAGESFDLNQKSIVVKKVI
jgi:transcription elongation GreA/GreB family factor